jgi:hypothetical protein
MTQHNDTQHSDTQHNDTQHNSSVFVLRVVYAECRKQTHYAGSRYAECRYAVCRSAPKRRGISYPNFNLFVHFLPFKSLPSFVLVFYSS